MATPSSVKTQSSELVAFAYQVKDQLVEALDPGMAPRVRDWGGGVKANLTNSRRSMLRFDQLESVNVEV